MRLNDQLESTGAYRTAVDESRSWLDATDSALSSLNDVVQHVRELTLQAANGSTSDAGRQSIKARDRPAHRRGQEHAQQRLRRPLHLQRHGDGHARPTRAATGDAYQGDTAAVVRQIGPGVSVQVNVTGDDVLSGLLPTLRTLSAHLASNDTASLGTTDLQAIDAGLRQPDRQARRRSAP